MNANNFCYGSLTNIIPLSTVGPVLCILSLVLAGIDTADLMVDERSLMSLYVMWTATTEPVFLQHLLPVITG